MLFAGFKVADGRFTMLEIVIAGVAGNLVGSWIAYGIGYYGPSRAARAPRQVAAHHAEAARLGGPLVRALRRGTVFFSRMIPVIRTFISLPAGVARMPFWKFTVLSVAGIIPWVIAFAVARQAGRGRLGQLAGEAALRRLRDRRGDRASGSSTCSCAAAGRAARTARAPTG